MDPGIQRKRSYKSALREEQARETRARITYAARSLFEARGYSAVTMSDIGREAGVAYQTVYAAFGNKLRMAQAVVWATFEAEGINDLLAEPRSSRDPEQWLRDAARIANVVNERVGKLLRSMQESGEPDLQSEYRNVEARRLEQGRDLATQLQASGRLKREMSVDETVDVLWAMTGSQLHHQLVVQRGWPGSRYEDWLGNALIRSLLDSAPADVITTPHLPPGRDLRPLIKPLPTIKLLPTRPSRDHRLYWGVLVAALGLAVQSVGYVFGWRGYAPEGVYLWAAGMAILAAGFGWSVLQESRSDVQRMGLGVVFGLFVYLSWLFASPIMARHFDELLHVSTLVGLIRSGFFQHHDMLAVGPSYPGLQMATTTVYWLTGLPFIACQVIIGIVSRAALMVALFALARRVMHSGRAAGLAVILYGTSTNFYYYNAQYTYNLPAVALFVTALYLLVRVLDDPQRWPIRALGLMAVPVAALCLTHHLTSWVLCIAVFALAMFFALGRDWRRARLTAVVALGTLVLVVLWSLIVGPKLIDYLGPIFRSAGDDVLQVLRGQQSGRQVGVSEVGGRAPLWELGLMAGSILVWVAMLLPSGWHVWRRGSIGRHFARYFVLAVAAAFPVLQLLRLTSNRAGEIGDRMSTFVFMGMVLVVPAWLAPRLQRFRLLVIPSLVVLLMGGSILGAGAQWRRIPGPFLPGADNRSVDAYSLAVADWVHRYLPNGSRIGADLTFSALIPTVANVRMIAGPGMSDVFLARHLGEPQMNQLTSNRIDFLVVDWRLADAPSPSFMSLYEGAGNIHGISAARFAKFDRQPGFKLILDGLVRVYDLRGLEGKPQTFADRKPNGLPGGQNPWQMAWLGLLLLALGPTTFRRWRVPHTLEVDGVLMVLPAMIALGAAGVVLQTSSVLGSMILTALAGTAWWRVHRLPVRENRIDRKKAALALATLVVVIFGAAIASWACATSLLPRFELPPPTAIGSVR